MNRFTRPLLLVCVMLAVTACQKQPETAKAPSAPAATTAPAAATPPAPAAAPPPAVAPLASADSIGVPECDRYVAKYMACVSGKVPEAARAQMQTGFDQVRTAWKASATTDAGKAGLAQACVAATEAAKTSMAAFGCTDF